MESRRSRHRKCLYCPPHSLPVAAPLRPFPLRPGSADSASSKFVAALRSRACMGWQSWRACVSPPVWPGHVRCAEGLDLLHQVLKISASSCPSTLSTNISFTKLGGSSVYISGPVTEAWTERPGEECFLWSFDRHNYLSLPQKLRGCSADISDPRRYRKRLVWESPGALHGSRLVTQAGIQRYEHSSLQPQLPGLK
ncbi:uncharacterized protein LOC117075312 isoform X5 [Trachypithecus francoisi]|uniref:uncharacterized protein LOC117075312 isoform X5 n=1 Tax=Trachypithecus francoisi TaxID=54180 RepID=UPI00141A73F3|nr:uncharacterized protein LOC117075312 isoform X5 [Trachypithecus francoisi]